LLKQSSSEQRLRSGRKRHRGSISDPNESLATFSSDGRILAAGELSVAENNKARSYVTDLWVNSAVKAIHVDGCGDGIAWTNAPDVFGCQDASGSHLRNMKAPQTDVGAAGPTGDLPLLKAGDSLWASGYKRSEWNDASKLLPLVQLGGSARVTVTIPGR
jgi:hypothetical protein